MKIGILHETKTPVDKRVSLAPIQCRHLKEEIPNLEIIVQPSDTRCFRDEEYLDEGILLSENVADCDVLFGVKEVNPAMLIPGKTYLFFSHTVKKQPYNKGLLKAVLDKHIRLIDYEMLSDSQGVRIIGFGRWAGLIGTYSGIRGWGKRLGLPSLPVPQDFISFEEMMSTAARYRLPPMRIAVTGDGRVAGGAEEMLLAFGVRKLSYSDFMQLKEPNGPVYVQLDPSLYNRRKSGQAFDLHHFFQHPEEYEGQFTRFLSLTDLLIMAAYWDPKAPVLFTAEDMKTPAFHIRMIADITCDIRGSVPATLRATTFDHPYYDYDPESGEEKPAFSHPRHVTMMTIDNLPCGLPRESSMDFGHHIMKSVLPLLHGPDPDQVIERATITRNGKLTERYAYLHNWVHDIDSQSL